MKRLLLLILIAASLSSTIAFAQGPYAPAAGSPGTTAIYKDSSILKSWATGIELHRGWVDSADTSVYYNGTNKASFGYPSIALGAAKESSYDVVSLGDGGSATLTFDRPIVNGAGFDFAVFENGFSDTFLELAFVEASSDGEHFVRFPAVSLTPQSPQIGGFDPLDPTNLNNLAGKYRQGYGTPFDLEDIKDSANIDIQNIRFIRLIDVVGNIDPAYATYDSQGHIVNEPWPTPFHSCGFDLDAIGIINAGAPYTISSFTDLTLDDNSYWNGSDNSGSFISGSTRFKNDYNADYGSWSGFAYSNMADDTTAGYTNQFSAITAGGMDATETGGTNYAVGYVPVDYMTGTYDMMSIAATFTDGNKHAVSGMYVTNCTYTALSMREGDSFAKKFGGDSGNDKDWYKLQVWAKGATDTVSFYLADFRFDDNTQDYIVNDWRWVDLSSLPETDTLFFSVASSDVGAYGMNTPSYFCMDNLTVMPHINTGISPFASNTINAKAYPNPFITGITVECPTDSHLLLFNLAGQQVLEQHISGTHGQLTTAQLSPGTYLLKVISKTGVKTLKVLKQ